MGRNQGKFCPLLGREMLGGVLLPRWCRVEREGGKVFPNIRLTRTTDLPDTQKLKNHWTWCGDQGGPYRAEEEKRAGDGCVYFIGVEDDVGLRRHSGLQQYKYERTDHPSESCIEDRCWKGWKEKHALRWRLSMGVKRERARSNHRRLICRYPYHIFSFIFITTKVSILSGSNNDMLLLSN